MINRRMFTTSVLAVGATLRAPAVFAAPRKPIRASNVVLVHGLFADGSSWLEVIPFLQAEGLNVTSVQNPLTSLSDAVVDCTAVLDRQSGPTVLAGHSFSGMVVTEVGVHSFVSAPAYVAARAPDAGQDYKELAATYPTPTASAGIIFEGDEGKLSEEAFLRDFAPDLPLAKARALFATQWPFRRSLTDERTSHAAWRGKPSFYAVSSRDRVIDPELQRFMAKRMAAETIEIPASHVSLLSSPREIAGLIQKAAGHG